VLIGFAFLPSIALARDHFQKDVLLLKNVTAVLQKTGLASKFLILGPDDRHENILALPCTTVGDARIRKILGNTKVWKKDCLFGRIYHHGNPSFRMKKKPSLHIVIVSKKNSRYSLHIDKYFCGRQHPFESAKHFVLEVVPHLFLPWTSTSQASIAQALAR
jgi:hypothetical protein